MQLTLNEDERQIVFAALLNFERRNGKREDDMSLTQVQRGNAHRLCMAAGDILERVIDLKN